MALSWTSKPRAIRQAEVGAARSMIDRTGDRFGLKQTYLAANSAYGSAANLAWLVKERESAPHIPVFDKSNRTDGTFSRADHSAGTRLYRASQHDCKVCELKPQCCPNMSFS